MKLCPKCGTQYPDDANFCHTDAARLTAAAEVVEDAPAGADVPLAAEPGGGDAGSEDDQLLDGRFELGERLGGRQTGEVYEAIDRDSGATCVVKVVDPEVFPKPLLMQRSERELRKLMRLDTPGVARVLGCGRRDERLWVACEKVGSCRSMLDIVFDEGPMPPRRAAELVVEVGKALSEVAKVGVIHRDLAPKNVLVLDDGSIKLINFGVAVPGNDKVQGVPEFVAPEIVQGRPVDQRANIYSLGALFYYAVCGRPPYMGDPEDVYQQHVKGEPEPPSTHLEGIPEAVDVVILRALERSSSKRFMTLRQFLRDVESIVAGEEPAAATPAIAAISARGKGKGKSKHLARTMLGGHKVASELSARARAGADDGVEAGSEARGDLDAGGAEAGAGTAAQAAADAPARDSAAVPERAPEVVTASGEGAGAAREGAAAGGEASAAGPSADPRGAVSFRETRWFKEGAEGAQPGGNEAMLSAAERARLSLETGATEVMATPPHPQGSEDEGLSSKEMVREMKGSRVTVVVLAIVAIVVAGALVAFSLL
ncbi:protein kinase domain-containing protein [Haliangium sp.]|uniref:protein kinase domain-containing protein n=1 Tax=Haliangium sp. TaxID=2663208 RepID=UPI003D0AA6F9